MALKVKIKFIHDGDVTGVISVVDTNSPIDIYLGIGGGPEGVVAAAALTLSWRSNANKTCFKQ